MGEQFNQIKNCQEKRTSTLDGSGISTFSIDFQDRLIQHKDGLLLQQTSDELEFEALSQDAILLMVQTKTPF